MKKYDDDSLELIKLLQTLAQYQIDATFIIAQAMACVSEQALRDQLATIRDEYEDNITELSDLIEECGGKAPEHSRDFAGFFMQGYVGMRGLMSDKGAMKALAYNTKLMADAFEEALEEDLLEEVESHLEAIYDSLREHQEYMEDKAEEL